MIKNSERLLEYWESYKVQDDRTRRAVAAELEKRENNELKFCMLGFLMLGLIALFGGLWIGLATLAGQNIFFISPFLFLIAVMLGLMIRKRSNETSRIIRNTQSREPSRGSLRTHKITDSPIPAEFRSRRKTRFVKYRRLKR